MKKTLVAVALLLGLNTFDVTAGPIQLTPGSSPVMSGDESSQAAIDLLISAAYPAISVLYKGTRDGSNSAGVSSEAFADSYTTSFFNSDLADSDARIAYVLGKPILTASPVFAYIKDGNATPNWYLFDITGWNGEDTIEFSGFFVESKNGNTQYKDVSHVSIYGSVTSVPDGGSALAMLGLALIGLRAFRRR